MVRRRDREFEGISACRVAGEFQKTEHLCARELPREGVIVLTTETIRALFVALKDELSSRGVLGEVGLCGGAVMCLVYQARNSTKDVVAVFEPTAEIREAAAIVARKFGLTTDWLNDAAKGFFLSDPPRHQVMELSNLRVWAPTAEYILAVKCVSARFDSHDRGDIEYLIRHLGLNSTAAVTEIICKYCPHKRVPAKTTFFVEEILEE